VQIILDDVLYELEIPEYLSKKDKLVSFTTYKNDEKKVSLLDTLLDEWGGYLIQCRLRLKKMIDEGMRYKYDSKPVYDVIEAIVDLFEEFPFMAKTLAKLREEGEEGIIRPTGKIYEEDGKKWFHKSDFKTRAGAEALRRRKLVKYIVPTIDGYPDYENMGWIGPVITSFPQFYKTFSELFKERMRGNSKFEKAYKVLERVEKERRLA